MTKETILALMEEWEDEVNVKNLTWHEITLLKSFGCWLELKATQHTLVPDGEVCTCPCPVGKIEIRCASCGGRQDLPAGKA